MPNIGQREITRKEISLMMPLGNVLSRLEESAKKDSEKDSGRVLSDNHKLVEKLPNILTQLKADLEKSNSLTGRIKDLFVDSKDYRRNVREYLTEIKKCEEKIGDWANLVDKGKASTLATKIKEGLADVPITVDGKKTLIGEFEGSLSGLFKSILKELAKLKSQLISVFAGVLMNKAGDMSQVLSAIASDNKSDALIGKCKMPFFKAGVPKSVSSKSVGSENVSAAAA